MTDIQITKLLRGFPIINYMLDQGNLDGGTLSQRSYYIGYFL